MFKNDFLYRIDTFWICLVFFLTMIIMAYIGQYAGRKFYFNKLKESEIDLGSLKAVEAGLFGLFSLLMSFNFNFTANRYDNTKTVLMEEANSIGSAILMANLYNGEDRDGFRKDFKIYLEAAIKYYNAGIDEQKRQVQKQVIEGATKRLWDRSSKLSHDSKYHMASRNMIPALKDMFGSAYRRQAAIRSRMPDMVLIMLYLTSAACVFLAGFTAKNVHAKERTFIFVFTCVATLVLHITLDYDRPLRGMITDWIGEETMLEKRKLLE